MSGYGMMQEIINVNEEAIYESWKNGANINS